MTAMLIDPLPGEKTRRLFSQTVALAEHVKIAEHAYQLAVGSGNLSKIKEAKRFWSQCDTDYQQALKQALRAQRGIK